MNKLKQKLLLGLMDTKVWNYFIMRVMPYLRFSTMLTTLQGWQYKRGYAILQPGDMILTVDKKKMTALLIPGDFSHAAFCVDKSDACEWEISEMTHTNYTKSTFFDLCKQSDRVVILRCNDFDADYIVKIVEKCKSLENAVYDVDFDFGDEFKLGVPALYCSELCKVSDFEGRLQLNLDDLAGLGRPYISPTGLGKAKNVTWVWDSEKEVSASRTKDLRRK